LKNDKGKTERFGEDCAGLVVKNTARFFFLLSGPVKEVSDYIPVFTKFNSLPNSPFLQESFLFFSLIYLIVPA